MIVSMLRSGRKWGRTAQTRQREYRIPVMAGCFWEMNSPRAPITSCRARLSVALGFLALGAACSSAQHPESCFYSDVYDADRNVNGRTLHWCGPVPRPAE